MNYTKGFFRVTVVISIIFTIIGMLLGLNSFIPEYQKYNSSIDSHNNEYSFMLDLLNKGYKNKNLVKLSVSERQEKNKDKIKKFKFQRDKDSIIKKSKKEIADEYHIKTILLSNINLDNKINVDSVSIKEIIDYGINKKLSEFLKIR